MKSDSYGRPVLDDVVETFALLGAKFLDYLVEPI